MLEALAGFVIGGALGSLATWFLLGRRKAAAPVPAAPAAIAAEPEPQPERERMSEVSELATASRQLLNELETRYQGRTVSEGDAKAPRRRAKSPRPKRP